MKNEERKIILELLTSGHKITDLFVAEDIYHDDITDKIVNMASKQTKIQFTSRDYFKRNQKSSIHQSMIAKFNNLSPPSPAWKEILSLADRKHDFCVLYLKEIEFMQNL